MKRLDSLEFKLFDTRGLCSRKQSLDELYMFWKLSWERTFLQLGIYDKDNLNSDVFLGKRIFSLWADQHPVGVVLLETHDLRMKCHQQSSYFEDYPNRAINTLRDNHLNLAYVISNMVIDPSWRKSQTDVPMSEALVSLTVWMAKEERADAVLGFSRKERSVDMILDSHGAFPLAEGFRFNCDVVYQCIPVKDAPTFPKPELKTVCLQYLSQMKPHHDELVQPTFEGYSIPQ